MIRGCRIGSCIKEKHGGKMVMVPKTAFQKVDSVRATYGFDGHTYSLEVIQGKMETHASGSLYRIKPDHGTIVLKLHDE